MSVSMAASKNPDEGTGIPSVEVQYKLHLGFSLPCWSFPVEASQLNVPETSLLEMIQVVLANLSTTLLYARPVARI